MRPNWDHMNEGQRRYAMEQYNLALVRRGSRFPSPDDDPELELDEDEQRAVDDFDLDLLDPSQVNQEEDDGIDDFLNQIRDRQEAGPSNMPEAMDTSAPVSSSSQGSTGAVKRPGTSNGGKPAKTTKTGTSLPGTGGNLDGMSSGSGSGPAAILRPIGLHVEKMTRSYIKKWRFLTSANANIILSEVAQGTRPARYALTTGMASIPWEYLFMYMSPAEYNRMKSYPGTFAKHCSITITSWNTRVAFQTGDTQTANATLNQNKFLQVAKGFRSIPFIVSNNRRYKFSTTEPMQPTGFQSQTSVQYRDGLKTSMYGYDNNSTSFTSRPPADATGAEIYLQDYLTIYTNNPGAQGTVLPGFPPYKNFIEEFDASSCVNSVVAEMEYTFDYAPLVPQFAAIPNSLISTNANTAVHCGTKWEVAGAKIQSASHTTTPEQEFNFTRKYVQGPNAVDTFFTEEQNYFKVPMEQGGAFEEVNRMTSRDSQQPSINVGIRAVPKLTTLDNTVQAQSWLDAQGYFEVECKLITESVDPFTYIKSGCYSSNTKTQLQHYSDATPPRPIGPTYDLPNEYGRMTYIAYPA